MDEQQKGKIYFSHDADAHDSPKMQQLISVYGYAGYGWYWRLIEQLTKEKNHKLIIGGKYSINGIAKMLSVDKADAERFVNDCINEFKLFVSDGEFFWSDGHLERMALVDKKREQARFAAKRSAEVRAAKSTSKPKKKSASQTDAERQQSNINRKINIKLKNNELLFNPSDINNKPAFMQHPFFKNEKFYQLWNDYMTVRDEKKIPIWSPTQIKAQWNKLIKYSGGKVEQACAIVEAARDGAWKGFWEIKEGVSKKQTGKLNDAYESTAREIAS